MNRSYKDAMNKITVDDSYAEQLKARLAREQARIDAADTQKSPKRSFNILVAASTAAVILLTVLLSHFSISAILERQNNTVYETDYTQQSYKGYTAIATVQDMSYRIPTSNETLRYNSNIYFNFDGFDKYGINLREICILFDTELDRNYTLANFFFDYYNIITQESGYTTIDNGLLDSFFGIKDNSNQTISVYDELRGEIVDLDSVLMEEYWTLDEVRFTVKVSEI